MTRTLTLAEAAPHPDVELVRGLREREHSAGRALQRAARGDPDLFEDWDRLTQAFQDFQRAHADADEIPKVIVRYEPPPYADPNGPGPISDFVKGIQVPSGTRTHDASVARERYLRNLRHVEMTEGRDVGASGFVSLVVPQVDRDAAGPPVRVGAPFVDALYDVTGELSPDGVVQTYPRATTTGSGPVAAPQTSDNQALNEIDPAYTDVVRPVAQIGARIDTSLQALERLGARGQMFIYNDLQRANADNIDDQIWNGTGANGQLLGLRIGSFPSTLTWTDASPTRSEFVSRVARLASDVAVIRKAPPTVVAMTARRWWWVVGGTQTATGTDVASLGGQIDARPHGPFGGTLAGLNVLVDDHLPVNLGAGTNEDSVLVLRHSDLLLDLEGGRDGAARISVVTQSAANTLSVSLLGTRLAWFSGDRYRGLGTGQMVSTGLINPGAW
jgi:Phage capsid family